MGLERSLSSAPLSPSPPPPSTRMMMTMLMAIQCKAPALFSTRRLPFFPRQESVIWTGDTSAQRVDVAKPKSTIIINDHHDHDDDHHHLSLDGVSVWRVNRGLDEYEKARRDVCARAYTHTQTQRHIYICMLAYMSLLFPLRCLKPASRGR